MDESKDKEECNGGAQDKVQYVFSIQGLNHRRSVFAVSDVCGEMAILTRHLKARSRHRSRQASLI